MWTCLPFGSRIHKNHTIVFNLARVRFETLTSSQNDSRTNFLQCPTSSILPLNFSSETFQSPLMKLFTFPNFCLKLFSSSSISLGFSSPNFSLLFLCKAQFMITARVRGDNGDGEAGHQGGAQPIGVTPLRARRPLLAQVSLSELDLYSLFTNLRLTVRME
jgi:hypothetical protein